MAIPRSGQKGVKGFPRLGDNERVHIEDGLVGIKLQNGTLAIIDADDEPRVSGKRWSTSSSGYVVAASVTPMVYLHRLIARTPEGARTDHKNHDKLDNRKANLRYATASQNGANSIRPAHNQSGFKGVCWDSGRSRWRVTIKKNQKQIHIGYFVDLTEAAQAYNDKAIELFGEFAKVNRLPL